MATKKRSRCPFPKCRRYAEHDAEHSLRTVKRTVNPKSLANLKPFQPGQSGNPGGRPKRDISAEIAAAIFEQNAEVIGEAYLRLLKRGSLGAFALLSDRAYGKVAQPIVGGGKDSVPIIVKIDC